MATAISPFHWNASAPTASPIRARLDTLSTQEMKVFRYILSGVDYTTIGSKMNISNKTVSTYKVRLMDKLGCSTLLELYDFAQRNKIG